MESAPLRFWLVIIGVPAVAPGIIVEFRVLREQSGGGTTDIGVG